MESAACRHAALSCISVRLTVEQSFRQRGGLRRQMKQGMEIVTTTATNENPTKKALSNVTMSMMTTMATVLHRVLKVDWSSFSFFSVQFVCIPGVIPYFLCCCLLLDWIVLPSIGLCISASLQEKPRNSSFHLLFRHILPCRTACILVRACAFDTCLSKR